jgi:hypothetical protein
LIKSERNSILHPDILGFVRSKDNNFKIFSVLNKNERSKAKTFTEWISNIGKLQNLCGSISGYSILNLPCASIPPVA